MTATLSRDALVHAGWWRALWGTVLGPWVRIKRDPAEPASLLVPDVPVVYVIERNGFSDGLILERACREAGLPSPLAWIPGLGKRRRAMFALRSTGGWFQRRRRDHSAQATIHNVLRMLEAAPERNLQLVPVAIYVGRAPSRQSGWFSVLFSEDWAVVGHFRRLLAVLLNGRDTIVRFSPPISLADLRSEVSGERLERVQRKLARVLRVHFRRVRTAVIGPDLSHRRTVMNAVLNAEAVRAAIATTAARENIPEAKAWKRADRYAREIAADYSQPFVRSASFLLSNFWNKLYDGIVMHHFDAVRASAPGHEVVYVPCHRSHADYVLMSYQLYESGMVVPHIAAGVNLNLPVLGSLLRRGGAFFLRRSFKANALYSAVFSEYVGELVQRGVPLEYFIEGGRSRTGRLLAPHAGMLVMTVRAFLRQPRRPVLFQPVYIGYEKLMEGRAYIGELSGQKKEKESWLSLLRGLHVLRQHYGRVTLSFGEPVALAPLLDSADPGWRTTTAAGNTRPEWLPGVIDRLAERIQVEINRSADVNPINLIAVALLGAPRHALAEADLTAQLELMKALLTTVPYSDHTTVTPMAPVDIIAYGEQMGWIHRIRHPLGDVLAVEGEKAVLLSYFRNNVLHLFTAGAWVACCFINNRRIARDTVRRLGRSVYPFIQAELFLPWDEDGFAARVDALIDFLTARGLLAASGDGRLVHLAAAHEDDAYQLRLLAQCLMQAFERYYIAVAALAKNGPHMLTAGQLENLCQLAAQRLSLLYQQSAPEFFDKTLFRGFIQKLKERHVVWADADGKLDFDVVMANVARDARVILAREVRQSIMKITPDVVATDSPE